MTTEQMNHAIAIFLFVVGIAVTFFSAGFYFFMRESWQIVLAFAGLGLMGLSAFADN